MSQHGYHADKASDNALSRRSRTDNYGEADALLAIYYLLAERLPEPTKEPMTVIPTPAAPQDDVQDTAVGTSTISDFGPKGLKIGPYGGTGTILYFEPDEDGTVVFSMGRHSARISGSAARTLATSIFRSV